MAIVKYEIDSSKELTQEEIEMIREAEKLPYIPDDDAPALTPAQIEQFRKIVEERNNSRRKQTVSLRISNSTLTAAKALGKSYTSILSTVLDNIFKDPQALEKYL